MCEVDLMCMLIIIQNVQHRNIWRGRTTEKQLVMDAAMGRVRTVVTKHTDSAGSETHRELSGSD